MHPIYIRSTDFNRRRTNNKFWQLYKLAWIVNFILLISVIAWSMRVGLVMPKREILTITFRCLLSGMVAAALYFASYTRKGREVSRANLYRDTSAVILWIIALSVFICSAAVLQYLTVSLASPDISDLLATSDLGLGFNWQAVYESVRKTSWLNVTLGIAYSSLPFQMGLVPIVLIFTRRAERYAEFVIQFMISALITIAIAAFFPAESAFTHFKVPDLSAISSVSDYAYLRSGRMRELSFASIQGLISLPSFHTVLAFILPYSARRVKVVFPALLFLNGLMLLSTLTHGGHYLVDVLAGAFVGLTTIWVSSKIFENLQNRMTNP